MVLPFLKPSIGALGERDPFFADTVLLMHFDGSDGSTSFVNHALAGPAIAAAGADIDTTRALFGGASGYFDGDGDYLWSDDGSAWDFSGDFTIEFALYTAQKDNNRCLIDLRSNNSGSGPVIETDDGSSGRLQYRIGGSYICTVSSAEFFNNTWHRIAMTRSGSTVRCYLDGALKATATYGSAMTSNALTVGAFVDVRGGGSNYKYVGWLDELRITRACRYAGASYLLATAPFPNQ